MKTSSVQEKSRGVLLFAFNTSKIDYVKIACRSARLVKHTLDLPVTLVTEQGTVADGLLVNLGTNNDVTVTSISAGDNNIGNVDS